MNVLISVLLILLSAVPAVVLAWWLVASTGLQGIAAAVATVGIAAVGAVALFALFTTLGRKAGVVK